MSATTKTLTVLAALACLAGCAAPVPAQRPDRPAPVILPDGYTESPTHSPPVSDNCVDLGGSLNPAGLSRNADGQPMGPALDRVRNPEYGLVVGLSQTAKQFSSRDLVTGELAGFEIDIVKRIAAELLGDPNDPRLHLVTMPTSSRLYALDTEKNQKEREKRQELRDIQTVDLVIADLSVTCSRVETFGLQYSARYLASARGLLVRQGMEKTITEPGDLGGRKVCSGTGTPGSDNMIEFAEKQKQSGETPLVPVAVADTGECLMLLQRGQVDAIHTDVLVLEGYRLQDPGTVLLDYLHPQSTGAAIAISGKDDDLVRFVNGVLDRMRADGSLQKAYDNWFGTVREELRRPLPTVHYRG